MTQTVTLAEIEDFFSAHPGYSVHVTRRFNVTTKATGEVTIYGPNTLGETREKGSAAMFEGDVVTAYNFQHLKRCVE